MTPSDDSGYCRLTSGRLVYLSIHGGVIPTTASELSAAERAEIARYMANLWAEWGGLPFGVD